MPIIRNCLNCNLEIRMKPSQAGRKKYCSKPCMYEYIAKNRSSYEGYKREGKVLKCGNLNCNKTFYRKPHEIKEKNFCSQFCLSEYRRGKKNTTLQNRTTLICKTCKKNFDVRKYRESLAKFCSVPCKAEYYKGKVKKPNTPNTSCSECSTPLFRKPYYLRNNKNFYCSRKCQTLYRRRNAHLVSGVNSVHWNGGKENYYGENWRIQRRFARERDNFRCQDCGKAEEDLNQELSVHHIIPFKLFANPIEANSLDNLISLCEYPCHRLRHTGDLHPTRYKQGENLKIKRESVLYGDIER